MTRNILTYLNILFIIGCFFPISNCDSQTISGKLLDSESTPIGYVNIGIVGKNVGTVSDENGTFTLKLDNQYDEDTLKFSIIGFKNLEFVVKNFKKEYLAKKNIELRLEKSITNLKEITVKPKEYKTKILGNTSNSTSFIAGFESNDLGSEIGTVMKIKKSPTFIENVNFNIASNKYDSVTFRVNIYKMENGVPTENILTEPMYITATKNTRTLTVDLKRHNLVVEGDFFVSIEWIKNFKGRDLYFCGGVLNADSFYRKTSQGAWKKVGVLGLGFSSTVMYEK